LLTGIICPWKAPADALANLFREKAVETPPGAVAIE
jgi:hypothetical protein